MLDAFRFLKLAWRSERRSSKPRRGTPGLSSYHRRLLCEALERRTLLSAGLAAGAVGAGVQAPSAAQQQTLAGVPVAAQQAVSAVFAPAAKLAEVEYGATYDQFGYSVAMSGNTLVVAAPGANGSSGVAYVFTQSGSTWTRAAELAASDAGASDYFGVSVAISGNTVVVGAEYIPAILVDGLGSQGAVYVFTEPASGWTNMTQTAELTAMNAANNANLGASVAISGNTVVADAPRAFVGSVRQGTAYVFTEPASGWADMHQSATLTASDGASLGAVSISGNTVIATGGGAAYLFTQPSNGWAGSLNQNAKLTASDGAGLGAVSIDGSTLAATGGGAAYVFTEPASGWVSATQTAKLTTPDGASLGTVSVNGNTVVAGAPTATVGDNSNQGAAYVFTEPLSGWVDSNQPFKLAASDGAANDAFGHSVALNGDTLVVGADGATVGGNSSEGAAYSFAASPAPAVTGISPPSGPSAGGTQVTITGGGFTEAAPGGNFARVSFGGVKATSVVINSDSQITATSPAGTAGTVDVTVTTAYGTSPTSPADKFTYVAVAAVTGVSTTMATGMYSAGTAIPITVTFSEPVTVTGVPQLALNAGYPLAGGGATANYTSGSGGTSLTFTYTVAAGQGSSNLDYSSTMALSLNGGTIDDAANGAAVLTLPAPGTDALAAQNIVIVALSDGFESGNFSAWPWQLSSASAPGGMTANWMVQKSVVHAGTYAAQSGAIGKSSSCTLSVTFTEPAGEIAFWRKVSSAPGSGLLIFEIDGTPVDQWSGTVPWQQSFYWVSAGKHTFSWVYGKDAGTPAGSDAAWLDDVQFLPGTTLTVAAASASDQFIFDASGAAAKVAINGEPHSFPSGEFNKYVFLGDGGTAIMASSSSGSNSALLYADGSAQLDNSTAGYAVSVNHMGTIQMQGQSGDTAQFFDGPGNNVFDVWPGVVRMYGSGYSNAVLGFGTNLAYATNGGNDQAYFFDSSANTTFYAYADYNKSGQPLSGILGGGYSDSAKGFATNVGFSEATNVTAAFFDSPGNDTFYAYASGLSAGMYGNYNGAAYSNSANGFSTNLAYSTNGGSDTAEFFDSAGNDTFYAYADYNKSGKPLAGMHGNDNGSGYANSASGFGTNLAYSINGGSDTALFYDSPGNDSFYAYADYNKSGKPLAGMYGSYGGGYSNSASGFGTNIGYSTNGGNDTAAFYDSPGNDSYYAYADYNKSGQTLAGMYGSYAAAPGGGYTNSASGFGTMIGISSNGGSDTASLFDSPGNDTLYTDAAIASLYGNNGAYVEQALGFGVVNAYGTEGGVNTRGQGSVNYKLNYIGSWIPDIIAR